MATLSKLRYHWLELSLPVKIAIIMATLGTIISLSYLTIAQPSTIAEISPIPVTPPIPPTIYCGSDRECPTDYSCQYSTSSQCTPTTKIIDGQIIYGDCPAPRKECVKLSPSPRPTPINWQTNHVSLQADSIEISTNTIGSSHPSKIFRAISDDMTPLTISSDPPNGTNPDRTTLETSWKENGTNMRIYLYFEKNTDPAGQQTWRLTKLTTYNGEYPGEVVDSYSGAHELYNTITPIGEPLFVPNLHLSTSGGGIFSVKITNLRLLAFLPSPSISPSPSPSSSPSAKTITLSASPPPTNLRLNQDRTININAHVDSDHLTAVQLELIYDPTKIRLSGLTPTNYLPTILTQPTYQPGVVTATYAVTPDSGGQTDWGTVANIIITPLTFGPTTIQFGPNTLVSAISSSSNALITPSPININIYSESDLNMDGVVNIFDYNLFVSEYGKEGSSRSDINGDQIVDIFDYNIFLANYTPDAPSPTTPISSIIYCSSDRECPTDYSCQSSTSSQCTPTTTMINGQLVTTGSCPAPRKECAPQN